MEPFDRIIMPLCRNSVLMFLLCTLFRKHRWGCLRNITTYTPHTTHTVLFERILSCGYFVCGNIPAEKFFCPPATYYKNKMLSSRFIVKENPQRSMYNATKLTGFLLPAKHVTYSHIHKYLEI